MSTGHPNRRDFLVDSGRVATAAWIAFHASWIAGLASCARQDAREAKPFTHLTPVEGSAMRAFAAQIIPPDGDAAGAEDAGAVYFIDRAFGLPFFEHDVAVVRAGLADLDARARAAGATNGFASLADERQIAIMRSLEHTAFFATARTLIVIGTFADPWHDGNANGVGWSMIGIDHRPSYRSPFGWYDAHADADSTQPAA
ncbi:MAG TPA: gluconate 2-dehydrogenase subunit 3 family protein [Gemmatimonadaceae bacterium]